MEQIKKYDVKPKARQLTKNDINQIATSLLDKVNLLTQFIQIRILIVKHFSAFMTQRQKPPFNHHVHRVLKNILNL